MPKQDRTPLPPKDVIDKSLRAQAMRRANNQRVPKTLTPYEWEQWYAENGVPEAHSNSKAHHKPAASPAEAETTPSKPQSTPIFKLWRRWFKQTGPSD